MQNLDIPDTLLHQQCTNPRLQVIAATKFSTVWPNMVESTVWNLLNVTILAPRILRWFLDFLKLCAPLLFSVAHAVGITGQYPVTKAADIRTQACRSKAVDLHEACQCHCSVNISWP